MSKRAVSFPSAMMSRSRPFERMPFDAVPALPRIPHDFYAHKPSQLSMQSSMFGPLQINCHIRGIGQPLLLLHGLMTTSYSWRYLIPLLARHYTVYVPDLPGAGRSSMPLGPPYSPGALARWVIEFQKHQDIYGCACVGNSMAGFIAMQAALREPACFSHLINVHSPGIPMFRFHALRTALSIPGAPDVLHWLINRDALRWAHRHVHYNDESLKSLEEAHEYGDPLTSRVGSRALYKYLFDTLDPRALKIFTEQLVALRNAGRSFPTPLTLVYAKEDPMVPPTVGRRMAELLPDARMVWMKNTSHFAQVDTPEELGRVILDALTSTHHHNTEYRGKTA